MPDDGKPNLVRRYFGSYKSADRGMIETLLSDDFTFTSPYDDQIGRVAYFERCWPAAGTFVYHDLKEIIAREDGCVAFYEGKSEHGVTFRNAEFFRFVGDRIASVEVFFGLRKIAGQWLIVHEHASEPFDPESGRARLDLTPDGQPGSAAIS
jgi:ketosteroid isomerase-like protein